MSYLNQYNAPLAHLGRYRIAISKFVYKKILNIHFCLFYLSKKIPLKIIVNVQEIYKLKCPTGTNQPEFQIILRKEPLQNFIRRTLAVAFQKESIHFLSQLHLFAPKICVEFQNRYANSIEFLHHNLYFQKVPIMLHGKCEMQQPSFNKLLFKTIKFLMYTVQSQALTHVTSQKIRFHEILNHKDAGNCSFLS